MKTWWSHNQQSKEHMEFGRNLEKIPLTYELISAFYRGFRPNNWLLKEPLLMSADFATHHCCFFLCCKPAVTGQGRKVPFSGKTGEREGSWPVPCQENSNPGVPDLNSALECRMQEHSHILVGSIILMWSCLQLGTRGQLQVLPIIVTAAKRRGSLPGYLFSLLNLFWNILFPGT